MPGLKGNQQLLKEINSAAILSVLHRHGMLSRTELAAMTKLSATTVSSLVEELLAARMVEEVGERPASGAGRRAIALRINRRGGYVVGLSLSNERLAYSMMDLRGGRLAGFRSGIGTGNEEIARMIREAILHCEDKARELEAGEMKGIGISAPGIVDEAGETLTYSVHLKLSELRLRSMLEERYPGIPIRILNDSNAAAFAEYYDGAGKGKNHLLYLYFGGGVGSGLILNGQIFGGYKGGAGEIGHIPLIRGGKLCSCGKRGCIETELASPVVLEEGKKEARSLGLPVPESAEEVVARYEASGGTGEFRELFERLAPLAAQTIAIAVNLISPEVVALAGWPNGSSLFMRRIGEELERAPFAVPLSNDRLLLASHGEEGPLHGAAALMLKQIFGMPRLN
ncbi:ROK family transcriptional regulator [Cohnella thailandensis]|uniref:ROK family transcriptional regulator n=1 Tax=Cohnella thailandensis TaxID=557557 RepID=A0A841T144_9BACL|nr:ROK family transcriptional regulator [Cohnella thailandensis]MBB6637262.1 ROK family transcriptional regulator [Cohnella thailandensis]MBP1976937.1 putative NBD/HSP70 family sugar kinase [Cohnella thailandensis]